MASSNHLEAFYLGVNIDPIMVFGLKRDQSLDTATRRGLFHKRGRINILLDEDSLINEVG